MSEFEMTSFEARFERRVHAYADVSVRDFDATEIARDAVTRTGPRFRWPLLGRAAMSPSYMLIITGLLLALVVAIVAASLLLNTTPKPIGRNGLIAYVISDLNEPPYNHIHLMNADGSNDREIAQGTRPLFSADGRWLTYFTGWGAFEPDLMLVRANADGSDPREIAAHQQIGHAFSPDATQVVVKLRDGDGEGDESSTSSYWHIDVESGERRFLMAEPNRENGIHYWDMVWSPDGESIAFAVMQRVSNGENEGDYRSAVDVVDVESGDVRRITSRPGTDSPWFAWSPDSRYIVYNGVPDGVPAPALDVYGQDHSSLYPDLDLFVVAADGLSDVPLTSTPLDERDPRWSPDAKKIAYYYWDEASGMPVVVVQPVEAGRPAGDPNEFPEIEGLQELAWSPDAGLLLISRVEELAPSPSGEQHFRSWLEALDPSSDDPPVVLAELEDNVGSLTWQWLEP